MHHLSLDPERARALGIADRLPGRLALEATAEWYRNAPQNNDIRALTLNQIAAYAAHQP